MPHRHVYGSQGALEKGPVLQVAQNIWLSEYRLQPGYEGAHNFVWVRNFHFHLKKRKLARIFAPNVEEVAGQARTLHYGSYIIFTLFQLLLRF
jgi:hypothetical protein